MRDELVGVYEYYSVSRTDIYKADLYGVPTELTLRIQFWHISDQII